MRPQRPRDPFGAELRRFAENIDLQQFRPLSPGIGLGQIKRPDPVEGLRKPYSQGFRDDPYAPPAVSLEPEQPAFVEAPSLSLRRLFPAKEVIVAQPAPQMRRVGADQDPGPLSGAKPIDRSDYPGVPRSSIALRMIKAVLGHGIDLFAVVISLVAALFIGGYFLGPIGNNIFLRVLQWTPVAELTRLSLIELVVGVYILFGVYWAFFRVFVGFTVGQGLIRSPLKNNETGEGRIKLETN